MSSRRLRGLVVFSCCLLFAAIPNALAQNENETVGFQTNHLFESGAFGENIDVLNGNLNLTVPIGPGYRVNQHLGYGLQLTYNSKIWDTSRWNNSAKLMRRGSFGLGFNLHFGRIYRDVEFTGADEPYECTWYYVSPDGNEHQLVTNYRPDQKLSCLAKPQNGYVADTTSYWVSNSGIPSSWDGKGTPPTFTVRTADGIIYTFSHFVQVYSDGFALNSLRNTSQDTAGVMTSYNRDYGGWYVTRIEDRRSAAATNWIEIVYDTSMPGYNHVIKMIRDSVTNGSTGRIITFQNSCTSNPSTGACEIEPLPSNPPACNCGNIDYRGSVRTDAISVPTFKGSQSVDNSVVATYRFFYEFQALNRPEGQGLGQEAKTHLLTRIEYPGATPPYAMDFGYRDVSNILKNGEILSRTLPTGAIIDYEWGEYGYLARTKDSASPGPQIVARARQLKKKALKMTPGEVNPPTWTYLREAELTGTSYTNPKHVIVTDPLGNDTIYYYHASRAKLNPPQDYDYYNTEDGFAPEWNDGINYRVETYQGTGTARKLLRTETREYDADRRWWDNLRDKKNVRMNRQVTIHDDDGGRRATVAFKNWDNLGHWELVLESGSDIEGTRTTWTKYHSDDPDDFILREVSDGKKVLSRTENIYTSSGLLITSIERAHPPFTPGTPPTGTPVAAPGDTRTEFDYHPTTGNVVEKRLTNRSDLPNLQYKIRYTWQAGGYLASKEFYNWEAPAYFHWC